MFRVLVLMCAPGVNNLSFVVLVVMKHRTVLAEYVGAVLGAISTLLFGRGGHFKRKVRNCTNTGPFSCSLFEVTCVCVPKLSCRVALAFKFYILVGKLSHVREVMAEPLGTIEWVIC